MIRGVSQPIQRTAAVVRAARDVRKPRTRWERLRDAARLALDDPTEGTRWERLMGLGVGLVVGSRQPQRSAPVAKRLPRLRGARPKLAGTVMRPEPGLRARLQRLQTLLNENAGPARSRDRRGIKKDPKKTR